MSAPENLENLKSVNDHIAYYAVNPNSPGIDQTGAKVTITYPHHEVHEGNFYTVTQAGTIAAGTANAFILAVQPGIGVPLHFQGVISAKNSGWVELWENATINASATLTPFNNNRLSSNTFSGTVTTGGTVLTFGTLLQPRAIGSSAPGTRIGGESDTRNEWILNPAYTYLIWFYADNINTQVSLDAEFYEETSIQS